MREPFVRDCQVNMWMDQTSPSCFGKSPWMKRSRWMIRQWMEKSEWWSLMISPAKFSALTVPFGPSLGLPGFFRIVLIFAGLFCSYTFLFLCLLKRTYKEHTRKDPGRNRDLSRGQKKGIPPVWETPGLTFSHFYESSLFWDVSVVLSGKCSLSLMKGPLSFKNGLSGPVRLGAWGVGTCKARSLRGLPRQKLKEVLSVKILHY